MKQIYKVQLHGSLNDYAASLVQEMILFLSVLPSNDVPISCMKNFLTALSYQSYEEVLAFPDLYVISLSISPH